MLLAALLCLVLGSLTSYIRARAEGVGLTATVGIAERAERLIIVLVGTGLTGDTFGCRTCRRSRCGCWSRRRRSPSAQRLATVYRAVAERGSAQAATG